MKHQIIRRRMLQGLTWGSTSLLIPMLGHSAAAPALAPADFVGVFAIKGGRIALSFHGRDLLVYICDGSDASAPTVARWLRGTVIDGRAQLTASGVTVLVQLEGGKASGTISLADGLPRPFLADTRGGGQPFIGLYRSEERFNDIGYVGGWIINPNRHRTALRERENLHPVSWSLAEPQMAEMASRPITRVDELEDLRDEFDDYPRPAGGIINQQTGALLPYAAPNLTTMTAVVPGLGTFRLHRCVLINCI